jgi:hypothetical protein
MSMVADASKIPSAFIFFIFFSSSSALLEVLLANNTHRSLHLERERERELKREKRGKLATG